MKVIFAGFSKTGTKTMADAFRVLGYTCYDSMEHYAYTGDDWLKIYEKGGSVDDFRRMFDGVDAVTDVPAAHFWEELHEAFPEAKIIFRMRASEDDWMKSMRKQIKSNDALVIKLLAYLSPSAYFMDKWFFKTIQTVFGVEFKKSFFGECPCNETLLRKSYRRHNSYVLEKAPAHLLFTINFDDGWEPLCEFLGEPVPAATPFPHKNKNAALLQDMLRTDKLMVRMKYEMLAVGSSLVALLAYGSYRLLSSGQSSGVCSSIHRSLRSFFNIL